MNAKTVGGLLIVFSAASISLSVVLSRLVFEAGGNAATLLCLRYPLSAAMLWLLLRQGGVSAALPWRSALACYGVGLALFAQAGGYLGAVQFIPVNLAILIFYLYPLLTLLGAAVVDRRRPAIAEVVGAVIVLGGLAMALSVSFEGLDPRGLALAFAAALGGGIAFIGSGRVLRGVDTLPACLHFSLAGLPMALLTASLASEFALPRGGFGWTMLGLALATFLLFYVSMFAGIRRLGAVPAALLFNLEPPITILLALLLLGEPMGGQQALGTVLVIGGIILAQVGARRTA